MSSHIMSFTIGQLVNAFQKNNNVNKDDVYTFITLMQEHTIFIKSDCGEYEVMDHAQSMFITHVLPNMLVNHVPRIDEVLQIYKMSYDTELCYMDGFWNTDFDDIEL